ncbi:MAG: cell division protein ZapA [Nitrosospira sp.]|nr:cell division protein ZapA [Nitrosospira sp.]MDW7642220.1 cell division protein ZapA [Nitrosomonadaceae bacterium]MBI0407955.1 cell division protein ZapA [Nitrosospira sp.]MBI0413949.1 cell division protein ZapA [Nitrosospira sp.]MBI0415579.1 cell division protein ZapA [Nitrosospira sp.]
MSISKTVDIAIMGREFHFTCSPEEREELLQSAAYLDQKMCEIKNNGKVMGLERIAIVAALNITQELLAVKVRGGIDIREFKHRINRMQATLDAVIPEQEKLF